jgi:hypothetical protein
MMAANAGAWDRASGATGPARAPHVLASLSAAGNICMEGVQIDAPHADS